MGRHKSTHYLTLQEARALKLELRRQGLSYAEVGAYFGVHLTRISGMLNLKQGLNKTYAQGIYSLLGKPVSLQFLERAPDSRSADQSDASDENTSTPPSGTSGPGRIAFGSALSHLRGVYNHLPPGRKIEFLDDLEGILDRYRKKG